MGEKERFSEAIYPLDLDGSRSGVIAIKNPVELTKLRLIYSPLSLDAE